MDKHTLALISILGSCLDVLGALYLAYDLLGGEHGPLRTLTRAVTYGVMFGVSYGLLLGPTFGIAGGVSHGITLAWEYSRASRRDPEPGFFVDTGMSAIRALGFGIGAAYALNLQAGVLFGFLSLVGQAIAYRIGIRPTANYNPAARLSTSRILLLAALNRSFTYSLAAYASCMVAGRKDHAIALSLRIGIGIGLATAFVGACTPLVEWGADRVPEKRMGVFGIVLILVGFTLQSVQYWVALLDIAIR